MIGYSVSSPVTLHYGEQIKKVPAVPDLLRPPIHCIQTGNGDELKRVRQYFDQAHPGQRSRYVQVIPLNELARWPYFPSWLGRRPGPESLDKIDDLPHRGPTGGDEGALSRQKALSPPAV